MDIASRNIEGKVVVITGASCGLKQLVDAGVES